MSRVIAIANQKACGITGFQDQLLKPLGHLSIMRLAALLKPLSFSDLFSLP